MQNEQRGVIRTKMADAMLKALHVCNKEGRPTGRIGRNILTANASGVGIKFVPRKQKVAA